MSRLIQSVDDLAQLPDDELRSCLQALRLAILAAKKEHAACRRLDPATPQLSFPSFYCSPRGALRLATTPQAGSETPIDEIVTRAPTREALKKLGIVCLEDLSEISEQELLDEQAIGVKTVGRLRDMLVRAGLDFLPDSRPAAA